MRRYALRYLMIIILALLLIPIHAIADQMNDERTFLTNQPIASDKPLAPSPFTPGNTLYGIAMPSTHEGWAVGGRFAAVLDAQTQIQQITPAGGLILHYQDGDWLAGASLAEPLLGISMDSTQDGWAVGYGGQLDHYHALRWEQRQAPTKAILSSVSMLSEQEGWAVGFGGTILHFHAQQWSVVASPTSDDLLSIQMVSAQEGWAVGSDGTILHYSQDQWQRFHSPSTQTLNSLTMLSEQEGWAVGNQKTILHYQDGIWSPVLEFPSATSGTLLAVAMTTPQTGWIVGAQVILNYNEEAWQDSTGNLVKQEGNPVWYALALHSPTAGWAVGSSDGIYHYQNGNWQLVYSNQ